MSPLLADIHSLLLRKKRPMTAEEIAFCLGYSTKDSIRSTIYQVGDGVIDIIETRPLQYKPHGW